MEVKKLYLAWQNPRNRSWYPVGILTIDESGTYHFVYTRGAKASTDFIPFNRMSNFNYAYQSKDLFPTFSNRLLSDTRPEYGKLLKWLGINKDEGSPLDMLAMTEGIRATDTLEVFKCPMPNNKGEYEVNFFSHGLRHLTKGSIDRANSLARDERLYLARDLQNQYDSCAMVLRTNDPVEFIGYCPRYLSPDFWQLIENNRTMDVKVTVVRVNQDAPLNLRLLCKLVAPWPAGFQPCSDENFKPLANDSFQINNETPAGMAEVS